MYSTSSALFPSMIVLCRWRTDPLLNECCFDLHTLAPSRQAIKLIWVERMTVPAPDHFLPLLPDQPPVHHCWRYRHYWQTTALIRLRFLLIDYNITDFSCLHCSQLYFQLFLLQQPFHPFPEIRPLLLLVEYEMKTRCDWLSWREIKSRLPWSLRLMIDGNGKVNRV